MSERGNSTHSRRVDDRMKAETARLTRNSVPDQEWRQPEPMPDDTDPVEVREALAPNPAAGPGTPGGSAAEEA